MPDLSFLQTKPLYSVNYAGYSPAFDRLGIRSVTTFSAVQNEVELYQCPDKNAEIHAVIEWITRMLDSGVPIDQIRIVNASDADKAQLILEADQYGFEISERKQERLLRVPLILDFIKQIEKESLSAVLSDLMESSRPLVENDRKALSALVTLVNQYGTVVLAQNPDLMRFELAERSIFFPRKVNTVALLEMDEMVPTDSIHYWVMNYTDHEIPRSRKATDYLSDAEKAAIGMRTSIEENTIQREETTRLLGAIRYLVVSFARKVDGQERKVSDLALNRPLKRIDYTISAKKNGFSADYDLTLFAKRQSQYERFGVLSADFATLSVTHRLNWHRYDAQFNGLEAETIERMIKRGVTISPTTLSVFYECRFKYFLHSLLKLDVSKSSMELSLGNLTHFVLSEVFAGEKTVEELAGEYCVRDPLLSEDERMISLTDFFVTRLRIVVEYLEKQHKASQFSTYSTEALYRYLHPEDANFTILGKIDRVISLLHENKNHVAVIDYKTGNKAFSDDDFTKGIDVQLVFYLHLLEKAGVFPAMKAVGFYYQPVNLGKIAKEETKDPVQEKLKLEGRTIKNRFITEALDSEGNIRGLAYKNDGGYRANMHMVEEERMNQYLRSMDEFITGAVKSIKNGDFRITPQPPKPNAKVSKSCEYCSFHGICYLADTITDPEVSESAEGDD